MIERLAGAVVAIAAAALLVAGVVTSAWWAGQTTAGGAQDVTIGLRSEQVCHLEHSASGKPRCTATTTVDCDASANLACKSRGTFAHDALFGGAGWGATLLGALAALLLAIAGAAAMSRGQDAARGAASAGGVIAVLGAVCAGVFVLLRPGMGGVDGTIGWPAYAYLGGAGAGVLASLILRRVPAMPATRPIVHARAPARPVEAPRGVDFDVGALFGEDEASAKAPPPPPPVFAAEERTDVNAAPPAAMLAARVPSEVRADTEKDLPPDDMQGTPAPKAAAPKAPPPPPAAPPPMPPMRAKPSSLPPLPLPRTKPPSLPPPFKPPTIPSGTGASPRVAAPDTRPPPPPPAKAVAPSAAGPVPACPQCDAPTVWNEEHLRFYCRACRIYL